MILTTLSGQIFLTLDIVPTKSYTYYELKNIFLKTINSDRHYVIIQNNESIFTDMYDIYTNKNKTYNLINPNIVFYSYSKEDTEKILSLNPFYMSYNFYDNDIAMPLEARFDLSQPELHKDPIFMKFCVSHIQNLLAYGSDEIKDDIDVIYTGLNNCNYREGNICRYISNRLKNDREFIKNTLSALWFASKEIKDDDEIIMLALIENPSYLQCVSNRIKNDKKFMMSFLEYEKSIDKTETYDSYFHIINSVGYSLKNDVEFVISFLDLQKLRLRNENYKYLNSLRYVGDDIKKNKEIINMFLSLEKINYEHHKINSRYAYNCNIYNKIDISLKHDKEIIKKCLELNSCTLKDLPKNANLDREMINLFLDTKHCDVILEEDEDILSYIPEKYRNDILIVTKTLQKNGRNYFYVPNELKNNTDIIANAIKYCYHDRDYYTDKHEVNHLEQIKTIVDDIMLDTKYKNITSSMVPQKIMDAYYDKISLNMPHNYIIKSISPS